MALLKDHNIELALQSNRANDQMKQLLGDLEKAKERTQEINEQLVQELRVTEELMERISSLRLFHQGSAATEGVQECHARKTSQAVGRESGS